MTFEESWPDVSWRLTRLLAAKRVPQAQRDDVIQETGIRLLRAWDRVDPDQGAWGLARTIAVHAIADNAGSHGRSELRDLMEVPDESDVERTAIARFRLSSVRHALSRMSPTDSRVLLAEVGAASPPTLGRSAMKMARLRARQRLRALVEKPGSWVVVPLVRLRARAGAYKHSMYENGSGQQLFLERVAGMAFALTMVVALNASDSFSEPGPFPGAPGIVPPIVLDHALIQADQRPARPNHQTQDLSRIAHDATPTARENHPNPDSNDHWLREDANNARGDAEQVGEDAEQLGDDAQKWAKDEKEWAEDDAQKEKEWVEEEKEWWEDQLP